MPPLPSRPVTSTGYAPPVQAPRSTPVSNYFPAPQTSGSGNWWSNQSPETQSALIGTGTSLIGGALSQRNANQQQQKQNEFSAGQNQINEQAANERLSMQLEQARMLAERENALQAQQMSPTRQNWRQGQALAADILPQLRNMQVTPPGDLGRYMPQISGGLRLPEGGLSQQALSFYSPQARLAAEMDLDRNAAVASGGRYATPDYAMGGYGQMGLQGSQQVNDYTQEILRNIMQQGMIPDAVKARGVTPETLSQNQKNTALGQSPASPFQRHPREVRA